MAEIKTAAKRLAEARNLVNVKKNGQNAFAKYKYYQIEDIYDAAKDVLRDVGLVTIENVDVFSVEGIVYKKFTLDVVNTDNSSDKLTFSAVTEPAVLKGAQAPQMAGADITYMTKYLYGLALMLDDSSNDPDANNTHDETAKKRTMSRTEIQAKVKELSKDKLDAYSAEYATREGKPSVVPIMYWKQDFLNEVATREGWI